MVTFREDQKHYYYLKEIFHDFNRKYGDIKGVNRVLKQFVCLWEENYWESLFIVHKNWSKQIVVNNDPLKKVMFQPLILLQSIKNGITPEQSLFEYSVGYNSFFNLYMFFEKLYSFYLGRCLIEDDLWALHKSGIAERVLGVLDQFHIFKGNIFLKDDFYQFLKGVSWDPFAREFFIKFNHLLTSFLFENQGPIEIDFNQQIFDIVVLLAHSSAVWSDSSEIHSKHIIKAYITLFKLISTDITFFADKRYYTGQLICGSCHEIYFLEENEAPFDFVRCSCGGDLEYVNAQVKE